MKEGDVIAATRIIPLYISEKELKKVERIGEKHVIRISQFKSLNVGLVITGSEVYTGRIQDGSSVVEERLRNYGLNIVGKVIVPDEISMIRDAILSLFGSGADLVVKEAPFFCEEILLRHPE